MEQTLMDKLTILADSAKYDVACTSSGASRTARAGILGSCYAPGCCHAFTADGRCVSLLKVLMTNCCAFDLSLIHISDGEFRNRVGLMPYSFLNASENLLGLS